MKVALGTVEISDEDRRRIADRMKHPGLATRAQVRRFVLNNGMIALDDLEAHQKETAVYDAERACEDCHGTGEKHPTDRPYMNHEIRDCETCGGTGVEQ